MFSPDEKALDNEQNRPTPLDDLLAAHADALLTGLEDVTPDYSLYNLTSLQTNEAPSLLEIAYRLSQAFTPVTPSDEFKQRLKDELVGEAPVTLLVRWRKLPAHYQRVAKLGGLTLTAGIALLAARRVLNTLQTMQHQNQPEGEKGLTLNTAS
jgi:hypothetical protein